jgi:hypothetical protein
MLGISSISFHGVRSRVSESCRSHSDRIPQSPHCQMGGGMSGCWRVHKWGMHRSGVMSRRLVALSGWLARQESVLLSDRRGSLGLIIKQGACMPTLGAPRPATWRPGHEHRSTLPCDLAGLEVVGHSHSVVALE